MNGFPGRRANLCQGMIDQVAQRCQAALQYRARCSRKPQISGFGRGKRKRCGSERVAQLMREKSGLLVSLDSAFLICSRIALVAKLCNRICNRVVQAAIERSELIYLKRRIALKREVRDGLAQVAVIVYDLINGIPKVE